MEATLEISPYLSNQKCLIFLIIAYTFSLTILEIRAEQILPGSDWG
jgi:hypothetical protein